MATIAKGMITLVNVNDAYSVSATPNVCAIKADFDGTNPVLDEAYSDITVVRGDVKVPFTINSVTPSNDKIEYEIAGTDATKRLIIKSIPTDALSGTLTLEVATEDEFVATVIFQYSVMRESTMLDWIKDWENNKTTIGSTYLITPKLFVGKKITNEADMSVLTGVYIGPDSDNGAGIYGYKQGEDIFHINEHGGLIGGWEIAKGGIQTSDGTLKILSEGSIISSDADGNVIWGLYKSGNATFAKGNVKFHADGSAEFAGTIKASDGVIGGWYIGEGVLRSNMMCLDANNNYIGVAAQGAPKEDGWDSNFHKGWVAMYGGVAMYYDNASSYGLIGYLPQTGIDGAEVQQHNVFSLGSKNLIAGWNFDDTAIWTGNKMNTAQQYTSESGSITLGTNGLRGYKWFIDSNGDVSFMGGKIKFTASDDGGEIVGWKLNPNRFSTNNVALVSDGSVTGLYMSANANANFNSLASTALENYIDANGGIYMNINDTGAEFAAYDLNGKKLFKLKSDDVSSIAGWNFNNTLLYTGTPIADVTGFTASADSISISPVGVFGYKWRFGVNGDGAVAGGNISWDEQGNVTFADSVKIGWNNLGGTIINSEGVFAGKISADNITAGTISTANIKNATGTWYLNQDGSGALANGNIVWDKDGNTTFTGEITATGGVVGGFDISPSQLLAVNGTNEMLLSSYLLRFRETNKGNSVFIGGDVMPPSMGGSISCPIRVEVERESDSILYGNIGLYVSVTGSKSYDDNSCIYTGNHALYIPNGDICGFRLRTRRVSESFTLSKLDSIILTVNTSDITITLPSSPEEGQIYMVKKINSGNYTLQVGSTSHYINDGSQNRKSSWKISGGQWIILVWDRVNSLWCAGYTMCN